MDFVCDRDDLLAALSFVAGYTSPKDTTMRLVHLETRGESGLQDLTISATDGRVHVIYTTPAISSEADRVLVDGALFAAGIASLDAGDLRVRGQKKLVVTQKKRRRSVQVADADDFPMTPATGDLVDAHMAVEDFLGALKSIRFALATESARPALTCFFFDATEGYIAAGDGARIAFSQVGFALAESFTLIPVAYSIISKAARLTSADELHLQCTPPGWVRVQVNNVTIYIATLGDPYPASVITKASAFPLKPHGTLVTLPLAPMRKLLKTAAVYADSGKRIQASSMMTVEVASGQMTLSMDVQQVGEFKEIVPVETYGGPQEGVSVGLSPGLLLQALQHAPTDQDVSFTIWTEYDPITLQHDEWLVVQVPMGGAEVAAKLAQSKRTVPPDEDDEGDF